MKKKTHQKNKPKETALKHFKVEELESRLEFRCWVANGDTGGCIL